MIVEQIQVGAFQIFCYVLGDEKTGEGIVVDPGGSADVILAKGRGRGIETIKLIVNTHGHVDHTAGNRAVHKATGAPVAIHKDDAGMLTNPNKAMLLMFNADESPAPTVLLKDGDKINFGGESVEVIHTRGHSPGGICLYFPGYVITGDTLFVQGIGRTDLPGGSFAVLQQSVRSRLFTLPGDTVVLPGHNYGVSPTSTISREMRDNTFI
ncbi:MAG: MBL fold metallo-hydrolase [Pseudomonadota bacterium]